MWAFHCIQLDGTQLATPWFQRLTVQQQPLAAVPRLSSSYTGQKRRQYMFSFLCVPVKKRLGPIKWLRTINALKNIRPTQKVRNMPNSSRTCMSKLFVRTFFTRTTLLRKRSPCWIWTENHTVRFDPEFRFAIEISYIEFALPFHNRYQD